MTLLTLLTKGNDKIEVSYEFALKSMFLKNMFDDLGCFPEVMEINTVETNTLKLMINLYTNKENHDFGALSFGDDIVPMLIACDYLQFEELFEEVIKWVAKHFQQLSVSEIRNYLGYENNFSDTDVEFTEKLNRKTQLDKVLE